MNDKYEKTIIAIMGKTSSGKNTIANYIKKKYNIPVICSYTTRTMRAGEQDGLEHYFINKEQMAHIMETEHILGYTKNEKTGIEYCATLESMKRNIAVYIINPNGLRWLEKHNPDVKLIKIYVYLEEEIIKKRALSRGDSEKSIYIRLDSERDEFDTYYKQVITGNETDVNVVSTNSDIVFKDIDKIIHHLFMKPLYEDLEEQGKTTETTLYGTDAVGGISLKISPGSENMINPFDIDREIEFDFNDNPTGREFVDVKGKAAELLNLFQVMLPNMIDAESKADISSLIIQMYNDFGITSSPSSLYEDKSFLDEETGKYYSNTVYKIMPRFSDFISLLSQKAEKESNDKLLSIVKTFRKLTSSEI